MNLSNPFDSSSSRERETEKERKLVNATGAINGFRVSLILLFRIVDIFLLIYSVSYLFHSVDSLSRRSALGDFYQ